MGQCGSVNFKTTEEEHFKINQRKGDIYVFWFLLNVQFAVSC